MSWPSQAVSQAWLAVSRIVSSRPRVCRCVPCRSSCAMPRACLTIQPSSQAASGHDTIYCIVHSPPARPCARELQALSHLPLGRIAGPPRPYCGRGWPCRGPALVPQRCQALLCHNTISCIVTQHQTWAVAHPTAFLSRNFFFFLIPTTGKPPKKNIFFSISSKPNKFIEIYFIHFFSSFTHCKTLEIFFFSSHHFFFHLILDHFIQNLSNT